MCCTSELAPLSAKRIARLTCPETLTSSAWAVIGATTPATAIAKSFLFI